MNDKAYAKLKSRDKHKVIESHRAVKYYDMERTEKDKTIWNRPPYANLHKPKGGD